jgi:hypothetical protein
MLLYISILWSQLPEHRVILLLSSRATIAIPYKLYSQVLEVLPKCNIPVIKVDIIPPCLTPVGCNTLNTTIKDLYSLIYIIFNRAK